MAMTVAGSVKPEVAARPRDDELDLFGLTHPGLVRESNQDQFLLCTVHPQVQLHATSLGDHSALERRGQRLATIMLVADGVGGLAGGSRASQIATEAVTRYIAESLRCYHSAGGSADGEFETALRAAAIEAHDSVRSEAKSHPDEGRMATTLCLGIVVWPSLYVVQVGDSRCYLYDDGHLRQLTRDQTYAQDLVDQGIFTKDDARSSPLSNVLASAIGASEAEPELTRVNVRDRGCVILLCTDGLTKHVTDAEIATQLSRMTSSEQVARALLDMALERGGTDNVTIVVGRANKSAIA